MKRNWMLVLLILSVVLFSGCTANTPQTDEDIWVMAEQITYDENGDMSNRQVYVYDNERNYSVNHYNSKNEKYGYTDVVQTKDGTKRTDTHYYGDEYAFFMQTDYEYRKDGKPLSQKNIVDETITQERIWNWNGDGTVAEVLEDGMYLYTVEYDQQGREIRSYNEDYETVYTYGEQEKVLRTSYTANTNVEYVVHKYDAQGRTIETLNYELDVDRPYTDDDIVSQSTCTYNEDGHSYVVSYVHHYETVQTLGEIHFIYKPLSELLK